MILLVHWLLVCWCLCRVRRNKGQGDAVIAIALAGGLRTIVEHMPLVSATAAAMILRAGKNQLEVHFGANAIGERLPEAGPAGAALIFCRGRKQGQFTAFAHKRAVPLFLQQAAGEGSLRAFSPQHVKGFRGEPLAPLGFTEVPGGFPCRRCCSGHGRLQNNHHRGDKPQQQLAAAHEAEQ